MNKIFRNKKILFLYQNVAFKYRNSVFFRRNVAFLYKSDALLTRKSNLLTKNEALGRKKTALFNKLCQLKVAPNPINEKKHGSAMKIIAFSYLFKKHKLPTVKGFRILNEKSPVNLR